jgi:hypothetical protein
MTDPIPPEPNTPTNISDEAVANFSWWLCMLPFFAAIGFFVWRWFQNKAEPHWLMYAIAALVIGLVFTAVLAGAGAAADAEAKAAGTTGDTDKK